MLFCSLTVLDPRVEYTMDVLFHLFLSCHSDWLFHGEELMLSIHPRNPQNLSQPFHLKGVKTLDGMLRVANSFMMRYCSSSSLHRYWKMTEILFAPDFGVLYTATEWEVSHFRKKIKWDRWTAHVTNVDRSCFAKWDWPIRACSDIFYLTTLLWKNDGSTVKVLQIFNFRIFFAVIHMMQWKHAT